MRLLKDVWGPLAADLVAAPAASAPVIMAPCWVPVLDGKRGGIRCVEVPETVPVLEAVAPLLPLPLPLPLLPP